MRYSIIVPVYNVENYLERCVDSIVSQFSKSSELILVDDGSTDKSSLLCDALASKYSSIKTIHQANSGLSGARNRGLSVASGEYVLFVDSDDYLSEDAFAIIDSCIDSNPDVDFFSFSFYSIRKNEKCILGRVSGHFSSDSKVLYINGCESGTGLWPVWKGVYKKSFLGNLRFPQGRIHEDVFWTTNCLLNANRFLFVDSPWYEYINDRSGSIMHTIKINSLFSMIDNFNDAFASKKIKDRVGRALRAKNSEACIYSLRCFFNCSKADKIRIYKTVRKNKWCFRYSSNICHKLFYLCTFISARLSFCLYSLFQRVSSSD